MIRNIKWNGFIKYACENWPNEVAGFLYVENIYQINELWHVFPVKNVSKDKIRRWAPDKKQNEQIKRMAKKKQLIKLGNVHTHPYPPNKKYELDKAKVYVMPSSIDLKFAQKYRDIIRGILLVGNNVVYESFWHDMWGNKINIMLNEVL